MKIFLGGTCNETTWREDVIHLLEANNMDYFNPVVDDWTPDCIAIEDYEKEHMCNVHLYVLTSAMTGVYSIAEIMDSVHTGKKTILHIKKDGFSESQLRSLDAVKGLMKRRGGVYLRSLVNLPLILINKHQRQICQK